MAGGLGRLFRRILPIITLICFICFGIMHIFQAENSSRPLTYLEIQYVDKENGENYTNPTEEQKNNSYKLYTFDMVNYTKNIDQDILKRSISHTFDLNAYQNTINRFKNIWEDGYQVLDGIKTIINVIVLVINSIILPINILLTIVRVVAGIILTALSLIGININNGRIIIPFLIFCVDHLSIPLVNGIYNKDDQPFAPLESNEWYRIKDVPYAYYYGTEYWGATDPQSGKPKYEYIDFDFKMRFITKYQYENIQQPMNPNLYYIGIVTGYYYSDQTTSLTPDYKWHFTIAYKGSRGVADWLIYDNGFKNGVTEDDICIRFDYTEDEEIGNDDYSQEDIDQFLYFLNMNMYIYAFPTE